MKGLTLSIMYLTVRGSLIVDRIQIRVIKCEIDLPTLRIDVYSGNGSG
jgi:hypothetical protein